MEDDFEQKNNKKLSATNRQVPPSIAKIFSLIESNKVELNIETYSLSQTSLEQVFLSFARKQFNPDEFNMMNHHPHGATNNSSSTVVPLDQNGLRYPINNRAANMNYNTNMAFDGSDTHIVTNDLRV